MSVVVYSKPDCVQCDRTKKILVRQNTPFVEREITPELAAEFKAEGLLSAPVVDAPGVGRWSGLRLDRLQALKNLG